MKTKNQIHFEHERLHIRVWFHRYYLDRIYGVHVPRLGGWT